MDEWFLRQVFTCEWPENATPEAVAAIQEGLPRQAVRRMSRLGMLCARVLRGIPHDPDRAIIYATAMSEARNLEEYLDSFPDPSPTRFQGSIHPAGAQQAMIVLGRPVREFYPLAGGDDLMARALELCNLAGGPEVILLAGEERGGWLRDIGLAEERSFAFALRLSLDSTGAVAVLRQTEALPQARPWKAVEFFDRLNRRENGEFPAAVEGGWRWQWL